MLKAVTANRLDDGVVVFLDNDNRWSERLYDARAFDAAVSDDAIEQLVAPYAAADEVVSVYVIPVQSNDGRLAPVSVREHIRAAHRPSV